MTTSRPYSILGLPTDILILILHQLLLVKDLAALSRTSRFLHVLVNEFGWAKWQRQNPRPSMSLSKSRMTWSPMARTKHDILTDRSWAQSEFIARPLSGPWPAKEQPTMATNSSRLVVAAGTTIYSYTFGRSTDGDAPPIVPEGSCSLATRRDRSSYITALTFIPDAGLDQTLCVGFQDGTFERIALTGVSKRHASTTLRVRRAARQSLNLEKDLDSCESLTCSRNSLLSLSASGRATIAGVETPTPFSSTIDLQVRSWSSHLCMESSSPYAAFGTSSATPLTMHSITSDRLAPVPSAVLQQTESGNSGSAVYGISRGPPSSPWGSSPQILVSGWYNGMVSIHDLRSSYLSSAPRGPHSLAPLRPVLNLSNSWSVEPIYSVSCGGGAGSHVAAGSARHSLLSLWDVRFPVRGFSVHAPLNDQSPVYAVILESSRLFGVTQSRPFVLDFGPGITKNTHPYLGPDKGLDAFGYYVTKYTHRPPLRA
ncbi:hypothetical protein DFH07DRAFT_909605 [Mycena maculata]|uniref:F-box domain-containing protein n=1 Tax=Mycena maculata TaxID=230809 RepID=A0AAD7KCN3_9AGAR|nr:hypothetical protein DFH07DRAFT_909605 [Mycena maculata]